MTEEKNYIESSITIMPSELLKDSQGRCVFCNSIACIQGEYCEDMKKVIEADLDYKKIESKNKDNWKHRSKKMLCEYCMFYVKKYGELGRCRKHGPTLNGWPAVYNDDWCGDHKVNEEKIK